MASGSSSRATHSDMQLHSAVAVPGTAANHPSSNPSESVSRAIIAQYTIDARLHAVFEQSGKSFDYSQSVRTTTTDHQSVPEKQITAYLSRIQSGGEVMSESKRSNLEPYIGLEEDDAKFWKKL